MRSPATYRAEATNLPLELAYLSTLSELEVAILEAADPVGTQARAQATHEIFEGPGRE